MIKEYVWEYKYDTFLTPAPIIIKAKTKEELQIKVMSFINRNGGSDFFDPDMAKITEVYDENVQDIRNNLKQFSQDYKGDN